MDNNIINKYLSVIEQVVDKLNDGTIFLKSNGKFDANLIERCSHSLKQELQKTNELLKINNAKRKLNQSFENFHIKRIEKNINILNRFLTININSSQEAVANTINECSNIIADNTIYELFDQFKYGDSNYILFGKNGSGKTSLLSSLSQRLNISNVIFTSATRNINYSKDVFCKPSDITLNNALRQTDNFKTMYYLSQCIRNVENNQRRLHVLEENIITNKIIRIFNSLGLERKLNICSNGDLELFSESGTPYSLEYASDGEKSAVYFLMVSLLAEENSFIFIDEPENHLNGSLMKKLFDNIELERKDVIYVYATHNVNFIESRNNIELVYLNKTNKKNEWVYNKFSKYDELPLDLILSVEGTTDNVIFCEGENDGSYDNKLLKELYPEYQIIASQGCEKVSLQTIIFNNNSNILRKKAIGLVDYDFRSDDEIKEMKNKDIFVLKVNEIENIFVLEECMCQIRELLNVEKTIDEIKVLIIDSISHKLVDIKKDFATKTLRKINKKNKIVDISNIEEALNKLNNERNEAFLKEYKSFEENLTIALKNNNYDELMKLVPGKMILKSVAKIFGLDEQTYIRQIFIRIKQKEDLKAELRKYII